MRKLTLLVALSLIVGALLLPAAALAAPPQCHIVNQTSDVKFDNLQAAVDAASPGDTLKLKGTCVGVTNIKKDLTIKGQSNPAFGPATLDGAGNTTLGVLSINPIGFGAGVSVTIEGLTITGGNRLGGGAGIQAGPFTTITLNDSTVSGNHSDFGPAGIFSFGSALTLNNSIVSDNTGLAGASGILATFYGFTGGSLTLNNSTVSGNTGGGALNDGGGIFVTQGCHATLNNSLVSGNSATNNGGGIYVGGGALTLNNSAVSDNSAGVSGGGIYNASGTLTIYVASTVSGNNPDNCVGAGCP